MNSDQIQKRIRVFNKLFDDYLFCYMNGYEEEFGAKYLKGQADLIQHKDTKAQYYFFERYYAFPHIILN